MIDHLQIYDYLQSSQRDLSEQRKYESTFLETRGKNRCPFVR